jgi:hypothetical protein
MAGKAEYTRKAQGFASDAPEDFGDSSRIRAVDPDKDRVRKLPKEPGYIRKGSVAKQKGC